MVKKKIISSLTVAGILGLSATGAVHAATTNDTTKTDALGVYSNIVEGKKVVPFILQSQNDRVTISDLKAKYPSAVITGEDNTVLKTGDTFTLNGVEHNILIYGDVYADGEVDIYDTMEVLKGIKGQGTLSDIQKAAANVNRSDDDVDIFDVMNVNSVLKGAVTYDKITTAPTGADEEKKEEEKKPDDTTATGKLESKEITADVAKHAIIELKFSANSEGYDYIIRNDTDNETISWTKVQNDEKKVTLTTTSALSEKNANGKVITYSITVLDENAKQVAKDTFEFRADAVSNAVALSYTDSKYKEITATNVNDLSLKVEVAEDMNYDTTVEVKLANYVGTNAVREAVGTATLSKGQKVVTINNFKGVADLENGTLGITIKVKDQYGNVSEVTYTPADAATNGGTYYDAGNKFVALIKNAQELKTTNITASRTGTENASVKMLLNQKLAVGEKVKVYYVVAKSSDNGTPTKEQVEDGKVYEPTISAVSDQIEIPSVEITNGVSNEEYVVYAIAQRENGAQTDIASAKITSVGAKQLSGVDNIQATSGFGNYRWTDSNNEKENPGDVDGYKVIVYAENVGGTDVKAIASVNTTTKTVDVSKEIKEFASKKENNGVYTKYNIGVIAVAKNGLRDSVEVPAGATSKIELTQLGVPVPVATAIYADEEKNYDLMFKFTPAADAFTEANTSVYEVSIYKVDKDGNRAKDASKSVKVPTTAKTDDVDLTSLLFKGQEKGKYAVTIKALAFEGEKYTDSAESVDTLVYYVGAPTSLEVKATDANKLKISVTEIPEVYSADQSYTVEYYAYYREKTKSNSKPWSPKTHLNNRNGTTVSTEIAGVTADTEYEVYVVAEYDIVATGTGAGNGYEISRTGIKAETTANIPLKLTLDHEKVVYDNKTIGTTKDEITNNGDTLYVGTFGSDLRKVTADNGVENYKEILDIVKAMSKGDKIRTDANDNAVVTKNVTGGNFGNTLANAKLVVNEDNIALSADNVKSVEVKPTVKKVYLGNVGVGDDGVDLTTSTSINEIETKAGTKIKLPSGLLVKVNGVYIKADAGIEVTTTATNELTIKGSSAGITLASDADANKVVKFTDSQTGIVTVVSAKNDKTITLEGAIQTVNIGNNSTAITYDDSSKTFTSKGIVDVTNVGYSTLDLVDVGAKVTITKVNKVISLGGKAYTFKPTGTMVIEKVNVETSVSGSTGKVDKLQVSGAGVVEFAASNETTNSKSDEAIISTPKTLLDAKNTTITTISSTVKYRVTDKKAYVTLEGNGKATLEN